MLIFDQIMSYELKRNQGHLKRNSSFPIHKRKILKNITI